MVFSVKITSDDGEEIVFGKEGVEEQKNMISDFEVHMDTVDNNASQKSMAMLAKIIIKGIIDEISSDAVGKLFDWSKTLDKNKWYRTLEVIVRIDIENDPFRTYKFENVFVVDYIEIYRNEKTQSGGGTADRFELYLTQKDGNFKTIESY